MKLEYVVLPVYFRQIQWNTLKSATYVKIVEDVNQSGNSELQSVKTRQSQRDELKERRLKYGI